MRIAAINPPRRTAVDTALVYRGSRAGLVEADDVLELVEKALLDVLRLAADAAQLPERFLLLFGQVGGNYDPYVDELVTATAGAHMRNAASADPDRLPVLGAGRDLDLLRPIDRGDLHGVAERGLRHAQRQLVDHVGAVSLQHRMRLDLEDDIQVARGATARADLALTREADLRSAVDAGGNVDTHLLFARSVTAAAAGLAGSLDHLALAVAARAAGDVDDLAEDRLGGAPDLAAAAALGARLWRGARLGAATLAGLAGLRSRDGQLAFDAEDRLFESEPEIEPKIRAAAWAGAPPASRSRAEEHVKDVIDPAESGPTEVEARRPLGGMAEGVIPLALGLVAQDLVGFVDLLEARLGLGVIGIAIGMKLQRKLAISPLQFLGAGGSGLPQAPVVLPLHGPIGVLGVLIAPGRDLYPGGA